ncbi:MAG: hypothetical protein ACHQIH_02215, partial [Ignavibacteria bacterium]
MKKLNAIPFVFVSVFVLTQFNGCGDEDIVNPVFVQVTDGAYILSEGTNPTNSALSFYSVDRDSFYQDIYSGDLAYTDGIEMWGGDVFIVEQGNFGGSGRLYQLDSNGGLKRS